MSIQTRAVPSHAPPKSNSQVWDAAAAVDRLRKWASHDGSGDKATMDWGKYESGFAWHDDEAGEHFGSYKLPHHDVEGSRLVVVWSGVAAAMSSLVSGRAGSIPESEHQAVYDHLKRHYAQFEQEPPPMNSTKRFWDFQPVAEAEAQPDEVDLLVYGVIDDWPWGDVVAAEFAQELAAHKNKQVHCRINSVGGDVFAGIAIHNMLQTHPGGARCTVEGLAASAASVIAMAGSRTTMLRGAMLMIHQPSALATGEASELRKTADVLDQISGSLVSIYQAKTGKPAEELQAMLDAETWMSAQEAVAQGFADEVLGEVVPQARGEAVYFNGVGFPLTRAPRSVVQEPAPAPQPAATTGRITRALLDERAPELVAELLEEGRQQVRAELEVVPAPDPEPVTRARLEETVPDLLASILAEGRAEGAAAERERIQAIEELAIPGHRELLVQAKFGPEPVSPEAFAVAVMRAERDQRRKYLSDARADAEEAVVPGSAAPMSGVAESAQRARLIRAAAEAGSATRK